MADMSPPILSPDKHPFQLQSLPGPKSPYEVTQIDEGLFVQLDMPGVAPNGIQIFKSSEKDMVTFSATAPKKESFPYDESERVYAGIVQLNKDPNDLSVEVSVENGSVILFFPTADGYLLFLPQSSSQAEGECSSSGKSIDHAEGSEKSDENEDSSEKSIDKAEGCNSEGLEKSEENKDSSETSIDKAEGSAKSESGESAPNESSEGCNCEGLQKSNENEDSSKKSIDKAEGSAKSEVAESASGESTGCNCEGLEKSEENEDSSKKSIDNAEDDSTTYESTEDPVKSSSNKSSSDAIAEAWIFASIKAYLLQVNTPEPPKEESALVETSSAKQSNHETPEIAIGSVEEMDVHSPQCQCQCCDSDGVCVKTWSTTENNLGYINKLKIKGPDGACEKRVVQEGGQYSLYVRADLPGLEPPCDVVTIEDRCILAFGGPHTLERCRQGGRIYVFFVQLQCSCCKFDNLCHDYEDGVLRLFCKIIAPERGPSAD